MILRLRVFGVGTTNLVDCTYEFNTDNAIGIGIPGELIQALNDTIAPVLRIEALRQPNKRPLDEPSWQHRKEERS